VFRERPGNYRHKQVIFCCGRIGLSIPHEIGSAKLREILDGPLAGRYARSSSLLDDLVDRRNEAAHGLDIDDVLDATTLLAIVDAMEQYAYELRSAIVASLCDRIAPGDAEDLGSLGCAWKHSGTGLKSIGEIIQQRSLGAICVGDVLIVGSGAQQRIAEIAGIGWGRRRPRRVSSVEGRRVALDFNRKIRQGEPVRLVGARCAEALRPFARWPD
jgi:hypothetical protein